jgi:hypothetical protein
MNEPAPAPTPPCMRVRTRRFRSDDQDSVPIVRCDRTVTSQGISSSGSPQIRTRTAAVQPQHLPPDLNLGLWCVVPPCPARRPHMLFLFVGSQFCTPGCHSLRSLLPAAACCPSGCASPRSVTFPQLPSSSICPTVHPGKEVHIQGTLTPLARTHAGRTQSNAG